jgi:hypothetical protein
MQHSDVCPGCGRSVGTQYAFMHQSGRTVTVFCLASCFVRWHREQKWRQHHTMDSGCVPRQAALSVRAFDDRVSLQA